MEDHIFIPCNCYYCEHEDVETLCAVKGCHQPASQHYAAITPPYTSPRKTDATIG